jgi:hypothetical protein
VQGEHGYVYVLTSHSVFFVTATCECPRGMVNRFNEERCCNCGETFNVLYGTFSIENAFKLAGATNDDIGHFRISPPAI